MMSTWRKRTALIPVAVLALGLLAACGASTERAAEEKPADAATASGGEGDEVSSTGDESQSSPSLQEGAQSLAAAGQAFAQAMKKAAAAAKKGVAAPPVDFRKLKEMLPTTAAGLPRVSAEGERAGAAGMVVSQAKARYEDGAGKSITIKYVDMGTMAGIGAMAAMGWGMADIDRESDRGFEQTFEVEGHKARKKYDRVDKHGEVSTLLGGRLMVEVEGRGVPFELIETAFEQLDLAALTGLIPAAPPKDEKGNPTM